MLSLCACVLLSVLVQRAEEPIHSALDKAGLSVDDVKDVVLVGGATRRGRLLHLRPAVPRPAPRVSSREPILPPRGLCPRPVLVVEAGGDASVAAQRRVAIVRMA